MGYYTSFRIRLEPENPKILNDLQKTYIDAKYAFTEKGDAGEEIKWYFFARDMIEFSNKYPNTLFIVDGQGEGSEDIWRQYFKYGKTQYCPAQISFDNYDENKLE